LREIAADANTPRTVLNYFLEPRHRRMDLMMPLIANKGVSDATLAVVAETARRELLEAMLINERVLNAPDVLVGLAANSELLPEELQSLKDRLKVMGEQLADTGAVFDYDVAAFMMEHAAELAA